MNFNQASDRINEDTNFRLIQTPFSQKTGTKKINYSSKDLWPGKIVKIPVHLFDARFVLSSFYCFLDYLLC